MSDLSIKIAGTAGLEKKLKLILKMDEVKKIVKSNGTELKRKMVQKATFRGHFKGETFVKPTGATKKSITLTIEDAGLTAKVRPTTHYAVYLEKGTRKMAAQPFVRPALREQKAKFRKDLEELVK